MRKLLHLVYAVWKTNCPFDPKHFDWEHTGDIPMSVTPPTADGSSASNDKAVGHKRDVPAKDKVVTTAAATVAPGPAPVKPKSPPARPRCGKVDFAFLREQVTMTQVLEHLGLLGNLRGRGQQRRGPCPIHGGPNDPAPTFSAHLGKNIFQCFHADCGAHGNVLDFWAALQHLPLYDAALQLAETFHLRRNRESTTNQMPVWAQRTAKFKSQLPIPVIRFLAESSNWLPTLDLQIVCVTATWSSAPASMFSFLLPARACARYHDPNRRC
jgi:hypothetical protein